MESNKDSIQIGSQSSCANTSCQTDEDLIYNYAWTKFYHHFNQNNVNNSNQPVQQTTDNGQIVPYKNGIYFDPKTALYFDQVDNLYFDRENQIYYQYLLNEQTKTFHLRYHSKIPQSKWKQINKKFELSTQEEIHWIEQDSDDERILAEKSTIEQTIKQKLSQLDIKRPTSEEIEMSSDIEDGEIYDLTNKYPPCIRAILIKSSNDDKLGSLFLIPYTGGSIGTNSKKNIIDLEDEDVEDLAADIKYDLKHKLYSIEAKGFDTFLNQIKLIPNEKYPIKHGDRLDLGTSVTLLLHIHNGSNTCIQCEPGEMMQKFKLEREALERMCQVDLETERREINKQLKKKYGIKWDKNDQDTEYKDRSKQRRKKVGIDTSHIEINQDNAASVHKPIESTNIGLKLLKKMGWSEGTGLGKDSSGITEPVQTLLRPKSTGLGFSSVKLSLDSTDEEKRKQMNWTKTKARFNLIDKESQKELANIFNEDDE